MIKKHLLGGALLVAVLVLLSGCKEIMSSLDNPVSAYFEVTPTQATIAKNQTCQISYSTISDGKVTFKSSAENIATVDAKGLVTGKTAGTAIITVELAATPYYQGATKNVEVTVDAVLSIDATEVTVGYGASINLVKDYHLARKGDATINYEIIEGSEFITLDETTKDITGKVCGDAKVKVSVPASATASSDELVIDVKVRIQNLAQLAAAIAASDDVTALLGEGVSITLPNAGVSLSGKKVTIKGDKDKPAVIAISEPISVNKDFIVENVKFDASGLADSKSVVNLVTTSEKAKKKDGSTSTDVLQFGDLKFNNVEISGLKAPIVKSALKGLINKINIEDCIIEFSGNKNIFDLGQSSGSSTFADEFIIKNSTLYSKTGHTGKLIKCDAKPKADLGYGVNDKVAVTLDHVTMYQISKGQQMNNSNGQMKGQAYMHQTMKSCILVYSGNHSAAVRGWMFGQNSTANTMVYDKNTYWNDADFSATWTTGSDTSNQGYDASGTALTSDPNFKDAANGDFTPQGADQVSNQTGDPRWFK